MSALRTERTDVLIVGAGPAGLLMANLLGAMNVRAVLIERNVGSVAAPRAVSIDDEAMRALQAAGLAEEVAAITARGYGSLYRGPDGTVFATVKPSLKEYGFDKRNGFDQPEYEALLREKLARFDHVHARYATEMVDFGQDADGVWAEVEPAEGDPYRVEAAYLVASDGARSSIRKTLGIGLHGSTFEEPWLIVDLESTANRCFHTEVFCDPARPGITLPGPNGIRRYEFMLRRDEDQDAAVEEGFVRALLGAVGPDRDAPLRRVQVYTFHARIADRWREGRVFLAGDAAHLTPPFAGQGMNSGARDIHNLAWKLAEAVAAPDARAADRLLASYEVERKPHAWSLIVLAMRMGKVMMPTSRVQGAAMRFGFRLLGLYPPARDYVAQMKYKPKPRFEAGLIWPDGRDARRTLVGRLIRQPVVETVARQDMLLDDALPDGPVVLVFSERPDEAMPDAVRRKFEAGGAAVVGITPEDTRPAPAAFPILRDRSRFFSEAPYAGYREHALLLRRDRYVAATSPADAAIALLEPLRAIRPRGADAPAEREDRPPGSGDMPGGKLSRTA